MHHSLGDGKFGMYHEMTRYITVASTVLGDRHTAAAEIDRVLNLMMYYSRPVYIGIPVNIGTQTIPVTGLQTPLVTTLPPNDPDVESKVVRQIIDLLASRTNPVIIVDGVAVRNDVIQECSTLIKLLGRPYFITAMSKGGISERLGGLFGGVYEGGGSTEGVRTAVEQADLVLFIGTYPSDFNTGEFTEHIKPTAIIDFQRFTVDILGTTYDVKMKYVLQRLIQDLQTTNTKVSQVQAISWNPYPGDQPKVPDKLTQDFLWPALGRYFRPGDYIIAETGTSSFGIPAASLLNVDNVKMYNQTIFGSIGYATGAALGSFVAGKENDSIKRGILVTGEGSLQLTVQAFSDLLRHELNTTVFVLNNDGYTIERLIHGMEAAYNKVPDWDYSAICHTFGPSFKSRYYRIATGSELVKLLSDPEFNAADCTQVVELILGKHDAPLAVKLAAQAVENFNIAQSGKVKKN